MREGNRQGRCKGPLLKGLPTGTHTTTPTPPPPPDVDTPRGINEGAIEKDGQLFKKG